MKIRLASLIAICLVAPLRLSSQNVTQQVDIGIRAINAIEIHGTSVLTIPARRTGATPVVTTSAASYAITTNEANRRILVSIDSAMPAGTSLAVTLAAPTGGQSLVSVPLSTAPQTAVTGISRLNERGLRIEYRLTTAPGSVVTATSTRTVSLTMVSGV